VEVSYEAFENRTLQAKIMKKIAIPQTLSGLLAHMLEDALGAPPSTVEGAGAARARKRLAEKRKRNKEVYGHLPAPQPSRQVYRAMTRRAEKEARSMRKERAMKDGLPGGAAAVL
jgi:hypothetical protein